MKFKSKRAMVTTCVTLALLSYPTFQTVKLLVSLDEIKSNLQHFKTSTSHTINGTRESLKNLAREMHDVSSSTEDPVLSGVALISPFRKEWSALQSLSKPSEALVLHAMRALDLGTKLGTISSPSSISVNSSKISQFSAETSKVKFHLHQTKLAMEHIGKERLGFGLSKILGQMRTKVALLDRGVAELEPLIQVSAQMLHNPNPKIWFVASQNLAEVRGTGGLIGSYLILKTYNGTVTLIESGSDVELASELKILKSAQSESFVNYWGIARGAWTDFNVSSDVPTAARVISRSWLASRSQHLSGVLFVGQGILAHLLGLLGSVEVDGHVLAFSNAADYLARGVYVDYPSVEKKNEFVQQFSSKLFLKLKSGNPNFGQLWLSAISTHTGDKPKLWSANVSDQSKNNKLGISGSVSPRYGHQVWLSLNNGGANKLDSYLHVSSTYKFGSCASKTLNMLPGQKADLFVTIQNRAPFSKLPEYVWPRASVNPRVNGFANSMVQIITVYAPSGADDTGIFLDGKPVLASFGSDHGHPTYMVSLRIAPGSEKKLKFSWLEPTTDSDGNRISESAGINLQPSFFKQTVRIQGHPSCAINNK